MQKILECVPNFSEGKNSQIIDQIALQIKSVPNVKLLGVEMGESANRTVFTFAGEPESVIEAAFLAIQKASELIDMRQHLGEHPRIGATDVCPLIPISGISMEETVVLSKKLAQKVVEKLEIPIFLYENSAQNPKRQKLEYLRSGEYEGLEKKLQNPDFQPDFGKNVFNAKSGASILGARNFLIAYNFNLATESVEIANKIAQKVRESGYLDKEKNVRVKGTCQAVKAIGWYIKEYGFAQVSSNVTNTNVTPLHKVHEQVCEFAKKYETSVIGAELIGLIPLKVLLETAHFYCQKESKILPESEAEQIEIAVNYLGLNHLQGFNPQKKIIEYALKNQ